MSNISDLAKKQARRATLLELLSEFEQSDPSFLAEIGVVLGRETPPRKGRAKQRVSTNHAEFDKLKALLESKKNAWMDTTDLIAQSGLSKPQVSYVTNVTHQSKFEKQVHPHHGKKKQWRLKVA